MNTYSVTFAKKGSHPGRTFLNGIPNRNIKKEAGTVTATIPFGDDTAELTVGRKALYPSWANANGGKDHKSNIMLETGKLYNIKLASTGAALRVNSETLFKKYNNED